MRYRLLGERGTLLATPIEGLCCGHHFIIECFQKLWRIFRESFRVLGAFWCKQMTGNIVTLCETVQFGSKWYCQLNHSHTLTVALSQSPCHTHAVTVPLSQSHSHSPTVTGTLSQSHCHSHTLTVPLSQSHCHSTLGSMQYDVTNLL